MVSVFGTKPGSDTFHTRTKFPPVQISFVPIGVIMMSNNVILYGSEVTNHSTEKHQTRLIFILNLIKCFCCCVCFPLSAYAVCFPLCVCVLSLVRVCVCV